MMGYLDKITFVKAPVHLQWEHLIKLIFVLVIVKLVIFMIYIGTYLQNGKCDSNCTSGYADPSIN